MKAVYMTGFGGREVLVYGEVEAPEPGPGEVRVAVRAAALNHLDIWTRRGIGAPELVMPHILGADVSGVVDTPGPGVEAGQAVVVNPGVSCGRCRHCLAGEDNLCPEYRILGEHIQGGHAEFLVVPEQNVLPMPERLSFAEAASVPLTFLTAWQMVMDRLKVKPGETVLVMAAGSGVSTAAIQLCKLCHARVIATASSDEKLAHARDLGADETVKYSEAGWHRQVRALTDGKGADAVVDHTGSAFWESVLKATASGGRIAVAGASSGYEAVTPMAQIFYRQLTIYGSTMGSKSRLFSILKLLDEGLLKPVIGRILPLEAAAEGHRLLEERQVFGKVVFEIPGFSVRHRA